MKKIVIMHFYNEEYLLPFWLDHHKRIFDHGILIDYASTDMSVEIIKKMTPNWDVLPSVNKQFIAKDVDDEVMKIEHQLEAKCWRIALNVTEFLAGDLGVLNKDNHQFILPSHVMVDKDEDVDTYPSTEKLLVEQCAYGSLLLNKFGSSARRGRSIHDHPITYPCIGRHFDTHQIDWDCNLFLLWYGFSPWNDRLKKRRTQIKNRIPEEEFRKGLGYHHAFPLQKMEEERKFHLESAGDMSHRIQEYIHYLK